MNTFSSKNDNDIQSYLNLTAEEYEDSEIYKNLLENSSLFFSVTLFIKFIFCIFVVIANIYLIVIICRNKNIKSVKANEFIMNYCIYNIILLFTSPILSAIAVYSSLWKFMTWNIYYLILQCQSTNVLSVFLCTSGLALDWIITSFYRTNLNPKWEKLYNKSQLIIGILGLLYGFIFGTLVYIKYFLVTTIIDCVIYFSALIFVIVCNYFKQNSKENQYSLTVANIITFSWLPVYIYRILLEIFYQDSIYKYVLVTTIFIPDLLACGNSILVIVFLGKLNKEFRMAYQHCCKRKIEKSNQADII